MRYTTMLNKSLTFLFTVTALLLTASCSNDVIPEGNEPQIGDGESGLYAEALPKNFVGSRSSLNYSSYGMMFSWTHDDVLSVFAKENDQAAQLFALKSGEGDVRATFSSAGFNLEPGWRYYCLSKAPNDKVTISNYDEIALNYSGQTQIGNANSSHLGKYDFMASSAVCSATDRADFRFAHLGFTLRVVMKADDSMTADDKNAFYNTKFTSLEIYDNQNAFRQQLRKFSFSTGTTATGYTVTWPEQEINGKDHFTLKIRKSNDPESPDYEVGIQPTDPRHDGTSPGATGNWPRLICYIELPPFNFENKKIGFVLRGKDTSNKDVTYQGSYDGYNMNMGDAYQVNVPVKQTKDYQVTIQLNNEWQLGNEPTSRATGDPGVDDEFGLPSHLYYIFCVDGKVRAMKDHTGQGIENVVNHIAINNVGDNKWTTDKSISTYGKTLVFPTNDIDADKRKQLYVIASKTELDEHTFDGIENGDTTTVIRNLKYAIPSGTQEETQTYLRDLYTTPWSNDFTFVGNLDDPIHTVVLYHAAAKVDLKWNYATAMTLTETDANSLIKVSDVKNSNLLLFTPAINDNESGSYSVTAPITYANYRNGRQVFYLPQFSDNMYNVTIGSHKYTEDNSNKYQFEGVTTTNGFTSWLRALIK